MQMSRRLYDAPMRWSLAQTAIAGSAEIYTYTAALLVLSILGACCAWWLRKRYVAASTIFRNPSHFPLDTIQTLHREGHLSVDERNALRTQTLHAMSVQTKDSQRTDRGDAISRQALREPTIKDPPERSAEPGFDLTGDPLPRRPSPGAGGAPGRVE